MKTWTILVEPLGADFEAEEDMPIMLAAHRAGVALPASCRNGTCRTCMCKAKSGSVRYDIEWPGLSVDEKREGYILPCVAYAASDLVIDEPRLYFD
jgi:ferredoxin